MLLTRSYPEHSPQAAYIRLNDHFVVADEVAGVVEGEAGVAIVGYAFPGERRTAVLD